MHVTFKGSNFTNSKIDRRDEQESLPWVSLQREELLPNRNQHVSPTRPSTSYKQEYYA
jgi:hypothetical protein